MVVYCKNNKKDLYLTVANVIASQILKKKDSVFGYLGEFEDYEIINNILKSWTEQGYIDFSAATLIRFKNRESYWIKTDLLIYAISEKTTYPRLFECTQALKMAEMVLVIAQGKASKDTVAFIFEETAVSENPAVILQTRDNVILVGERDSLSELKKVGSWYH